MAKVNTNDTVGTPCAQHRKMARNWSAIDDLLGGVERMRYRALHGRVHLPQEIKEDVKDYRNRVDRSRLYPGLKSALDNVVSKPFSREVQVDGLPDALKPLVENTDGSGVGLTAFARQWFYGACSHGVAYALVDYSRVNTEGEPASVATEKAIAARPSFTFIHALDLIGWEEKTLDSGEVVLSEIRFKERRTVKSGKYTNYIGEFLRVIRMDSFEVWQNKAYRDTGEDAFYELECDKEDWGTEPIQSGALEMPEEFTGIPLVGIYTDRVANMIARPPLKALADTNIAHWQSNSDQVNILHVARVPILFAQGFADDEKKGGFSIGAGVLVSSREAGAQLSFVEHSGQAIESGQYDLERQEKHMEILGVRPLIERTQDSTATGVAANEARATCDVQAWVQGASAALTRAIKLAALWYGVTLPDDFKAVINDDFTAGMGSVQEAQNILKTYDDGLIDAETCLSELKRLGALSQKVDVTKQAKKAEKVAAENKAAAEKALNAAPQPLDKNSGQKPPGEPGRMAA